MIVLVIAGIASVKNYAIVKPKPTTIEGMNNELKEESSRIVDYGIYNKENITKYLNNFTDEYASYFLKKTDNANVIFIYGNKSDLYSGKYESVSVGKVTASLGAGSIQWSMTAPGSNRTRINVLPTQTNVVVTIFNKDYTFDLKDNEMFYFVMVQEKEGEVYVEKNPQ